jgi:hypothetical protein
MPELDASTLGPNRLAVPEAPSSFATLRVCYVATEHAKENLLVDFQALVKKEYHVVLLVDLRVTSLNGVFFTFAPTEIREHISNETESAPS